MSFGIQAEGGRILTPHADQHDATLMVELFKIIHSPEMSDDWAWFTAEFDIKTWPTVKKRYPPGSEGDMRLRRLLSFWEMVGAFVCHDILNETLLFNTTRDPIQIWAKIEPWIGGARKELGPEQWVFIEELAMRAAAHANNRMEGS